MGKYLKKKSYKCLLYLYIFKEIFIDNFLEGKKKVFFLIKKK